LLDALVQRLQLLVERGQPAAEPGAQSPFSASSSGAHLAEAGAVVRLE
jgi:hypothetical protein